MKNISILILSNDKDSAKELKNLLDSNTYNIIITNNPFDAMNYCIKDIINLLIVDIVSNNGFGLEIIKKFRDYSSTLPILVLIGRNDIESKIIAFNAGANDLLVKPFNVFEFKIRVNNQLKMLNEEHHETFKNGDLTIDYDKRLVKIKNKEIHLTNLEYKILALLANNLDKVLTYDYIIDNIWGKDGQDYNGLRVFVCGIRNKLKTDRKVSKYIRTQVNVGYKMKRVS